MDQIKLQPPAKIHDSLDVLRKLPDDYHEVRMSLQTIKLHDDMLIRLTDTGRIDIKTNHPDLPTDGGNLVYAACEALLAKHKQTCGVYIDLHKRIPIAAGLGGGSSDAASALVGLRELLELDISDDGLIDIGKNIGADVPFFIRGGTALACGIGDELTQLPKHPYVLVLICKPDFNVSTTHVYQNLKMENIRRRPNTEKIIEALKEGDLKQITVNMRNVLETVTQIENPIIIDIKDVMREHGALRAMMSGSGPAVFGYFTNHKNARRAARELSAWPGCAKGVFLTSVI
jgi:4-diphosphocytidyl-2-C-methyl-D-erythritol kinase